MAKKRKRNLRLNYLEKRAIMDAIVPLIVRVEGLSYKMMGLGPEYFDPKQKIEAFRTKAVGSHRDVRRELASKAAKYGKELRGLRDEMEFCRSLAKTLGRENDKDIKHTLSFLEANLAEGERLLAATVKARKGLGLQQLALSGKEVRKRVSRVSKLRKKRLKKAD